MNPDNRPGPPDGSAEVASALPPAGPDEQLSRVPTREDGQLIIKRVMEFGAAGVFKDKSPTEIDNILWLIRGAAKGVLNPTQRALLESELSLHTGLKPKALALPPAVDLDALQERAARERQFAKEPRALLIDPDDGIGTARRFLACTEDDYGWSEIVRHAGDFYVARPTHYVPTTDEDIAARLYSWLEGKADVASGKPLKVDRPLVEGVLHATKAAANIQLPSVPGWRMDPRGRPRPEDLIPFKNGLLEVSTRRLLHRTRGFFTVNARDFFFVAKAAPPRGWLAFLESVFGTDVESAETLQELFGLLMTSDTSFQKAFVIVGPPRSGKGTILEILRGLLGLDNVCAPTLAGLGGPFGLQGLIGKSAALISDARMSTRADANVIGETILRVSGEDAVSVPRKFRDDWNGKLSTRFVIVSNEVPALFDQSGALASRFVILQLRNSFLGKEDLGLKARLAAELPGIALWALEGLDRLRDRGYFRQPAAAKESLRLLEMLSSPIKAFVTERCTVAPGGSVPCADLYQAWVEWTVSQGREHPGTLPVFGRNLAAAFPGIRTTQPRVNSGHRERHYEGICLRPEQP